MTSKIAPLEAVTPTSIDNTLVELARDIGCEPPDFVPVLAGPNPRPETSVAVALDAVGRLGGAVLYGRILTACAGLWNEAHFHAVRRTTDGLIIDHSPADPTSTRSLFAPCPDTAARFDLEDQPRPIRCRTYRCLDDASSDHRKLETAIDEHLRLLAEFDAVFVAGPKWLTCTDSMAAATLSAAISRAHRRLTRLYDSTFEERPEVGPSFRT